MNPGIYGLTSQEANGPYPLLGRPMPVPTIDQTLATHPDAQDWHARVLANGGSVSHQTLRTVSQFCGAVDSIGIRDRFYRLNLFAGSNIAAAMVPLYRSRTVGGPILGSTVDTNNGPFVSSDYTERGSTGGLTKSDGTTTKYIDTGLAINAMPSTTTGHVAFSVSNGSVTNTVGWLLGKGNPFQMNSGTARCYVFFSTTQILVGWLSDQTAETGGTTAVYRRWSVSRSSQTLMTQFREGLFFNQTTTSVTNTPVSNTLWIFSSSTSLLARIHYYSFGDALTQAQANALDVAFADYLRAMGRT